MLCKDLGSDVCQSYLLNLDNRPCTNNQDFSQKIIFWGVAILIMVISLRQQISWLAYESTRGQQIVRNRPYQKTKYMEHVVSSLCMLSCTYSAILHQYQQLQLKT